MAVSLVVGDIVEVKLIARCGGQYSINTLHYQCNSLSGTGATDVNALTAIDDDLSGPFKNAISADAFLLGTQLQVIKPTRYQFIFTSANSGGGDLAGDVLPRQTSGLIRKVGNLAGKRYQGRMYVPFPTEPYNSPSGHPITDYVDLLNTLGSHLIATVTAGGGGNTASLIPRIFHRSDDTTTGISTYRGVSEWATQRRRADIRGGDRPPF